MQKTIKNMLKTLKNGKKFRFEVKEVKVIRFEELQDEYDDAETKREFGCHQIATITTLRLLGRGEKPERRLLVVNAHLFWNPFYNFVRLRQIDVYFKFF